MSTASNDNNKGLEDDPFTNENELCAGMKFNFPKYEIYNRSYVGKKEDGKNQYRYTLVGTDVDKVRNNPTFKKASYSLLRTFFFNSFYSAGRHT